MKSTLWTTITFHQTLAKIFSMLVMVGFLFPRTGIISLLKQRLGVSY